MAGDCRGQGELNRVPGAGSGCRPGLRLARAGGIELGTGCRGPDPGAGLIGGWRGQGELNWVLALPGAGSGVGLAGCWRGQGELNRVQGAGSRCRPGWRLARAGKLNWVPGAECGVWMLVWLVAGAGRGN